MARISYTKPEFLSCFLHGSILPITLLIFVMKPVLSKEYGVVQITSSNFDKTVIDGGDDAWIVAVKGAGKVPMKKWRELEVHLRGLMVRVGVADPQTDGAFLKRKGFLQKDKTYTVARVYPYGGYKIKVAGLQDVKKLSMAKKLALQSLPDETTKIQTNKELEEFVNDAYVTKPPRFPVLLFSEKRVALPEYRAAAFKYSKYFNFGVMRNPSIEFRLKFVIEALPMVVVMLGSMDAKNRLTFNSVRYESKAYGPLSYFTLAKFIFSVHEKHWKEQPNVKKYKGEMKLRKVYLEDTKGILEEKRSFREEPATSASEEKAVPQVVQITYENHKKLCKDSTLGLCVISYLDGRDKRSFRQSLRVLRDVQKMAAMDDKPFHYLWVNASCHPEYGENFGISSESLPTLLVAKPRQRLFTILKQNFDKEHISDFLSTVLLGKEDLLRYSRFNDMLPVYCSNLQPPGEDAAGANGNRATSEDLTEEETRLPKEKNGKHATEEL